MGRELIRATCSPSRDMFPSLTMNNMNYGGKRNVVFLSESSIRGDCASVLVSNRHHYLCCQSSHSVLFSFSRSFRMCVLSVALTKCLSAFRAAIRAVVGSRSQPQMRQIAAGWIVSCWTIMEHARRAFWNLTVRQHPNNAVRMDSDSPRKPESTMAEWTYNFDPRPALVHTSFIDAGPKSLKFLNCKIDFQSLVPDYFSRFVHKSLYVASLVSAASATTEPRYDFALSR